MNTDFEYYTHIDAGRKYTDFYIPMFCDSAFANTFIDCMKNKGTFDARNSEYSDITTAFLKMVIGFIRGADDSGFIKSSDISIIIKVCAKSKVRFTGYNYWKKRKFSAYNKLNDDYHYFGFFILRVTNHVSSEDVNLGTYPYFNLLSNICQYFIYSLFLKDYEFEHADFSYSDKEDIDNAKTYLSKRLRFFFDQNHASIQITDCRNEALRIDTTVFNDGLSILYAYINFVVKAFVIDIKKKPSENKEVLLFYKELFDEAIAYLNLEELYSDIPHYERENYAITLMKYIVEKEEGTYGKRKSAIRI